MFWSLVPLLLQRQPEKGRAIFQFQGAVHYGGEVMTGRARGGRSQSSAQEEDREECL